MSLTITTKNKTADEGTAFVLILLTVFILGIAAVVVFVRHNRRCAKDRITDGNGMNRHDSPGKSGLHDIPESAVLNSLNWGQSSSNEYECLTFDVNRDTNSCKLSGRYTDPESDRRTDIENIPLSDKQLKDLERHLKCGIFRGYTDRVPDENVYDEPDSLLCVGWRLSDGNVISVKYNGTEEKTLFELLKLFLNR